MCLAQGPQRSDAGEAPTKLAAWLRGYLNSFSYFVCVNSKRTGNHCEMHLSRNYEWAHLVVVVYHCDNSNE